MSRAVVIDSVRRISRNPFFWIIAFGVFFLLSSIHSVLDGFNPDGYLRIVLAQKLWDTGEWFDHTLMRTNPPFGMESPWTRPLDLLVLLGAVPLQYVFSVQQAHLIWGTVLPLGAFVATAAMLDRLGRLLRLARSERLLVAALLTVNPVTWGGYFPLYVDHHYLLTLLFLWLLSAGAAAVQSCPDTRHSIQAGLALGFGLWVSPEFFLPAAAVLAGLGGVWLWQPQMLKPVLPSLFRTAAIVAICAVLLERADPFSVEHDSVSIVHVALLLILAVVSRLVMWTPSARLSGRLLGSLCGTALAVAVMNMLFPSFWRAHYLATDSFVVRELLTNIGELQPLWKYVSPVFCLAMLLLAGMGAFRAIHRSVKGDSAFDPGRWVIFVTAACIMAVFSVMQGRWMATYGMVLLVLLAAPVLNQASEILQRLFERRQLFLLRRVMAGGVMLPVLLLGVAESLDPVVFPVPDPVQASRLSACQKDLVRFIRNDGFARASALNRPLILMLPTNYAGVVWFWTPHTVIAGNYHRDVAGIRDVITFFRADAATAQEILARRRVDLVAYCTGEEGQGVLRNQGQLPVWLERLETEEASDPDLQLYRVNLERTAAGPPPPVGEIESPKQFKTGGDAMPCHPRSSPGGESL